MKYMKNNAPAEIGEWLYKDKLCGRHGHDLDWGASVVGVMGGQGSVKTACCLDIAEKKLEYHKEEKIFWHDTLGSPCQFRKAQRYPFKIFVEEGYPLKFFNATQYEPIHPDITFFTDVEELYRLAEYQMINVVYFKNKKSWVGFNDDGESKGKGLIEYLMSERQNDWQTVVFDEMETLFPAVVDNQTSEKWYSWTTKVVAEKIKECRKCRVSVVGNYHQHNSIFHSIRDKFMFHIWGFGSRVRNTSVIQRGVNSCKPGEFWIDHQGNPYGKFKVQTRYNPPKEQWIAML